jgi:hypothetical protein
MKMQRSSLFFGVMLILLGGLFFLQAQGLIKDVSRFIWPLFLMVAGAWVLLGAAFNRPNIDFSTSAAFSIDLQGARQINFDFDHGAGQVQVTGGAPAGVALSGLKGAGIDVKSELSDGVLEVEIEAGPTFIPFIGPEGGVWQFQLTSEVPVNFDIDAGASTMTFDLSQVKLQKFRMDTGASSLKLVLPTEGIQSVEIESGAASIEIVVPTGLAARLRLEGGASSLSIDETRFVKHASQVYQTADFDGALHKVEMRLEGGANSISVHS